jgi:hypothetical protein
VWLNPYLYEAEWRFSVEWEECVTEDNRIKKLRNLNIDLLYQDNLPWGRRVNIEPAPGAARDFLEWGSIRLGRHNINRTPVQVETRWAGSHFVIFSGGHRIVVPGLSGGLEFLGLTIASESDSLILHHEQEVLLQHTGETERYLGLWSMQLERRVGEIFTEP